VRWRHLFAWLADLLLVDLLQCSDGGVRRHSRHVRGPPPLHLLRDLHSAADEPVLRQSLLLPWWQWPAASLLQSGHTGLYGVTSWKRHLHLRAKYEPFFLYLFFFCVCLLSIVAVTFYCLFLC
jgi:hypothetical protein